MLNVAIIGAGNVGKIRSEVIRGSSGSQVGVVADVDEGRAQLLAASMGASASADWRSAVESPQIDVVVVCTPTKYHTEIVKSALQAGKDVLCEKPLARSAAEALEVIALAKASEKVLRPASIIVTWIMSARRKNCWKAMRSARQYFLRCRYGHGGKPGYEKHWCTDLELSGGGALLEQGIHIVDLVRYLLGEPTEVSALAERFFWDFPAVEDNCFPFENKVVADSSNSRQLDAMD